MPTYTFVCSAGHDTDVFFQTPSSRTKTAKCSGPRCRRRARYSPQATLRTSSGSSINFIPDIPEHYNTSGGFVVTGRRQLRQEQKRRGLTDYEPVRQRPVDPHRKLPTYSSPGVWR